MSPETFKALILDIVNRAKTLYADITNILDTMPTAKTFIVDSIFLTGSYVICIVLCYLFFFFLESFATGVCAEDEPEDEHGYERECPFFNPSNFFKGIKRLIAYLKRATPVATSIIMPPMLTLFIINFITFTINFIIINSLYVDVTNILDTMPTAKAFIVDIIPLVESYII